MKYAVLAAFLSFLAINAEEEEDVKTGQSRKLERRNPQVPRWGKQQPAYTWGNVATSASPWAPKQTQSSGLKGWPVQSWPKQQKPAPSIPNQMASWPGGQYTGFGPGGLPLETKSSRYPTYPGTLRGPRFTPASHLTPQTSAGSNPRPFSFPSIPLPAAYTPFPSSPRPGTVQGSPAPVAPWILPSHIPAAPAQQAPKSASPTATQTGHRTASSPGSRPPKPPAAIPLSSPPTDSESPANPDISPIPSPSIPSPSVTPLGLSYPRPSLPTGSGLPAAWLGASIQLPPLSTDALQPSPANLALTISGTYWSMPRNELNRPTPKPKARWQPKPLAKPQPAVGGSETSEYEFKDGQWYRAGQLLPLPGSSGEPISVENLNSDTQPSVNPPRAGLILGWSPFRLVLGPRQPKNKGQLAKRDWSGCTDITVLYASGSNEQSGRPVVESLDSVLGQHSITIRSLDFPADYSVPGRRSVSGSPALVSLIERSRAQCPKTKLVVSGSNQGAAAVHDTFHHGRLNDGVIDAVMLFDDHQWRSPVRNMPNTKVKQICVEDDHECARSAYGANSAVHARYGYTAEEAAEWILHVTKLISL